MKSILRILSVLAVVIIAPVCAAQDASIERLLKKLPPPEKFVDEATRDPLAKQVEAAVKASNFGSALDASRRLVERYPKSAGAQMIRGVLAMALRKFPEAATAYRKVLSIRPDLVGAHIALGVSNIAQGKYRVAFADFEKVSRLAPKSEAGWIGMSACAEGLGLQKQSLEHARRATTVAPASWAAWAQVAREEGLSGNKQAASAAFTRSSQLLKRASKGR